MNRRADDMNSICGLDLDLYVHTPDHICGVYVVMSDSPAIGLTPSGRVDEDADEGDEGDQGDEEGEGPSPIATDDQQDVINLAVSALKQRMDFSQS